MSDSSQKINQNNNSAVIDVSTIPGTLFEFITENIRRQLIPDTFEGVVEFYAIVRSIIKDDSADVIEDIFDDRDYDSSREQDAKRRTASLYCELFGMWTGVYEEHNSYNNSGFSILEQYRLEKVACYSDSTDIPQKNELVVISFRDRKNFSFARLNKRTGKIINETIRELPKKVYEYLEKCKKLVVSIDESENELAQSNYIQKVIEISEMDKKKQDEHSSIETSLSPQNSKDSLVKNTIVGTTGLKQEKNCDDLEKNLFSSIYPVTNYAYSDLITETNIYLNMHDEFINNLPSSKEIFESYDKLQFFIKNISQLIRFNEKLDDNKIYYRFSYIKQEDGEAEKHSSGNAIDLQIFFNNKSNVGQIMQIPTEVLFLYCYNFAVKSELKYNIGLFLTDLDYVHIEISDKLGIFSVQGKKAKHELEQSFYSGDPIATIKEYIRNKYQKNGLLPTSLENLTR